MFDAKKTRTDQFYSSPVQHYPVDMMHARGTYNLYVDKSLGAYVLQLPYMSSINGNEEDALTEISMFIILPLTEDHDLDNVLAGVTADTLQRALNGSFPIEIDLSFSKFEFKQTVQLTPILGKLGISQIFGPGADFSDFSKHQQIVFSDATHIAKIKVDEQGSTAAAATVLISARSSFVAEPTKIE